MASGSPWSLLRALWGSLSPPGSGRWYLLLALRLLVLSFARGTWRGPPRDLLCAWAPPAPPPSPGLRRLCAALCYNRHLPAPTAALWSLSLLLALLPVALRRLLRPPDRARHRGEGGPRPDMAAGDDGWAVAYASMAAGWANVAAEGADYPDVAAEGGGHPDMAAEGGPRPDMAAGDDDWAVAYANMAAGWANVAAEGGDYPDMAAGHANMAGGYAKMAARRANMAAEGGGHPNMAARSVNMAAGGAKMAAGQAKMAARGAKMAAGPHDTPARAKMAAVREGEGVGRVPRGGADKMAARRGHKMAARPRPADESSALMCAGQWDAAARPRPVRESKMAAGLHPPAPPTMTAGRVAACGGHDGRVRWRAWLWAGSAAILAAGEGGFLWAVLWRQLPAVTALPIGCRAAAAHCPPLACALPARADKMAALVGVAASAAASLLVAVADALLAAARALRGRGPERAGPA